MDTCPNSPYPNGTHQYAPVPEYLAAKMAGYSPMFYCVFDLTFVNEQALRSLQEASVITATMAATAVVMAKEAQASADVAALAPEVFTIA